MDAEIATTKSVTLDDVPVVGVSWTLKLTIGRTTSEFTHLITDVDLSTIAVALAALVNESAPTGFTAVAEGDALLIVDSNGRDFETDLVLAPIGTAEIDETMATTTLATLSGTPETGDVWKVRFDGLTYTVTLDAPTIAVIDIDGTPGVSTAEIATALAAAINADTSTASENYLATTDGAILIIVNREGNEFVTLLEAQNVTRSGDGYALVTLDYSLDAEQLQERLQALYGFEGINVEESRAPRDVTYTITFFRNQAGIDFDQIEWNETRQTTGLIPSPGASVNVLTDTIRDGALVNSEINNIQTITINATGGTFTLSFLIENELGEFVLYESVPIYFDASALDMFKVISPILNPNGATTDIDPEFDRVTRTPYKPYTDNVAVIKIGNVFHIIFQGEHRDLLIHDIDTRALTADEARVTTVTLGGTEGSAEIDDETAWTTTVSLTGTPAIGEIWTVRLSVRGVASTHDYRVGDTLADIAAGLAAEINVETATYGYLAVADGADLTITGSAGFTAEGSDSLELSLTASADTHTITLTGTEVVGENWTITLDDGGIPVSFTYTVEIDTLDDIAAALADDINIYAADAFTATADGSTLVIVNRDGELFVTSLLVDATLDTTGAVDRSTAVTTMLDLNGTPALSEVWTVTLDNGSIQSSHLYTVGVDDTLSDIAQALADHINTNADVSYAAVAEGDKLLVVNRSGTVFLATFEIIAAGQPKTGEVWTVVVDKGMPPLPESKTTFSYTAGSDETHATVAAALADMSVGQLTLFQSASDGYYRILQFVDKTTILPFEEAAN